MIFHKTKLSGAYIIEPEPFQDERGLFARIYCSREFAAIGHKEEFVQFNHSHNIQKGTLRGLHYQQAPHAEIKLIRCIKGSVFDIIVDIRQNSPTFLQSFGVELSAENMQMIYIPKGFCHGFQTLEAHSELIYHHSSFYQPESEGGIRYDDPMLDIRWPLAPIAMSLKDLNYKLLDNHFKGIEV